jgi:hypothetical protein
MKDITSVCELVIVVHIKFIFVTVKRTRRGAMLSMSDDFLKSTCDAKSRRYDCNRVCLARRCFWKGSRAVRVRYAGEPPCLGAFRASRDSPRSGSGAGVVFDHETRRIVGEALEKSLQRAPFGGKIIVWAVGV